MTELISRPESSIDSHLYRDRVLSAVESGIASWPVVERRRAPRRRHEGQEGLDRRLTLPPAMPMLVPAREGGTARRDRHVSAYRKTVLTIDVVVAAAAAVAAQLERFGPAATGHSTRYWWGVLALPALWVMGVGASRAYESRFLASSAEEYRRVVNAAVGLIALIALTSYLSKAQFARGYVVVALPTCALLAVVGRYFARHNLRRARASGRFLQEVVVVGHEWPILDLVAELRRNPDSGLRVIGACVPGGRGSRQMAEAGVPVVGDIHQVHIADQDHREDIAAVLVGAEPVRGGEPVQFVGDVLRGKTVGCPDEAEQRYADEQPSHADRRP